MPLTLENVPGFADVPDSALGAESPALALNLNRISLNAALGMVRPEVFYGVYIHGETVGIPVSPVDGYQYSRSELIYVWATQSTLNPTSGWITGPDSLWYCAWIVDQATGNVECIEYYRRSGSHDNAQSSNDGALGVFTIAQRQAGALSLAQKANSWTDIPDSSFVTDAPLAQAMAQTMNRDAKLSVLNSECIYMGEFVHGQTVPTPVSPADGYAYTYAQTRFAFSWRWNTSGAAFTQPPKSIGQLGEMKASINAATGVTTVQVSFIPDEFTNVVIAGYGRIAVFAFCSRASLLGTFPAVANAFAEIDPEVLMPGTTLRASTMLQLQKNIREAVCSCEFFGPTTYADGNTVPLPTSPVDGYVYSRDEIRCVWEWSGTTNSPGVHNRTAAIWGDISQTTGVVTLRNWRMPPGGPYVEDGDIYLRINVVIVAQRGAQHSAIVADAANPASDIGSAVVDNTPPDIQPYAVSYYGGETVKPGVSEVLLRHVIPGDLASVTLPINLTGSYAGCMTAATSSFVVTIKKGSTTIGTMTIGAGATTATFSFVAAVTLSPGDTLNFSAPGVQDATLAGFYFTLSGTRT